MVMNMNSDVDRLYVVRKDGRKGLRTDTDVVEEEHVMTVTYMRYKAN